MMKVRSAGNDGPIAELRAKCSAARAEVAADPQNENVAAHLFDCVAASLRALSARSRETVAPVPPAVAQAAGLIDAGRDEEAEILLRRYLTVVRNQPDAMLLMANIAARCGFFENAEKILRRSVELHPGRVENWLGLARVLHDQATREDKGQLADEAITCLTRALALDPAHEEALGFNAALLVQLWRLDEAHRAFERLVEVYPESQSAWTNFAHLLKTRGAFGEAVAAYRTAIALDPENGMIWWLFADLKLARFFPADIARMRSALAAEQPELAEASLRFGLAAALHQARDFESAAEQLRIGNALRLKVYPHDIEAMHKGINLAVRLYTPRFFADRSGSGNRSAEPIFVVGLPRSGSTLVEQILSSHSMIEGTAELFAVQQIEAELFREHSVGTVEAFVKKLRPPEFERLGQRYLDLTQFHRRTDRERFVDKNPGNWRQTAFIHLMLPNARIVDIRRDPLDCCFANYSQHFMVGVNYSYGQAEMASQYRDYVHFMRHIDKVLPGRVHRIIYEDLVDDLDGEIRRLFTYLGLPFEESCLRFFETQRPVRTPSSEQVRRPINRSGIGKWRAYEPWLGELVGSLGNVAMDWRD